jgi:uncharacterized protein
MLKSLRRAAERLGGITVAAALLAAAAPVAARAEPAMWVARDADSTVYLFGTIHVLRPGVAWRSARIDQAYTSSQELWLEMDEGDDPTTVQALVARLGLSPQTPLSSRLTAAEKAKLTAAAGAVGLPAQALEPMRPWLAALTLTVAPLLKAGYDPKSGVDQVLETQAKADGKPLKTFETAEQQFRFFADLPAEVELEMLRQSLDEAEDSRAVLDRMADAWVRGDSAALEREVIDEMRADYPEVYAVLFTERNKAWAERIDTLMDGSGVHFVAVGAGHLLGPDSVQAQLAARGIATERR